MASKVWVVTRYSPGYINAYMTSAVTEGVPTVSPKVMTSCTTCRLVLLLLLLVLHRFTHLSCFQFLPAI